VEERDDAATSGRTDIGDFHEVILGEGIEGFQVLKAFSKDLRHLLTNFFDAKTKKQTFKRLLLAVFDRVKKRIDGLIAPAIEFLNLVAMIVEVIDIRDVAHEVLGEELLHDRFAHAIDIHGVPTSEVNHPFDLAAIAFRIETIMKTLHFGQRMPADRAGFRHDPGLLAAIALIDKRSRDFRNDVRGLMEADDIADHEALIFDKVLIVEGGSLNQRTCDPNRLQNGIRSDTSRAANGQNDIQKFRRYFSRRELVGDGPARFLSRIAKAVIKINVIDFKDKTIDVVA